MFKNCEFVAGSLAVTRTNIAIFAGVLAISTAMTPCWAQGTSGIVYYPAFLSEAPQLLADDPGSGRCPDSTQPCFKNNNDILNGRRSVLRDDDVAFVGAFQFDGSPPAQTYAGGLALTSNSQFASVTGSALDGGGTVLFPTVNGIRMFNRDRDTVVKAAYIYNTGLFSLDVDGNRMTFTGDASPLFTLSSASADFAGQGYADLVYLKGGTRLQVVTQNATGYPNILFGPELTIGVFPTNIASAVATGNFGGTGYQIAVIAVTTGGMMLELFSVDPVTLQISLKSTNHLNTADDPSTIADISIATGRFSTALYDQIVIAYTSVVSNGALGSLITVDFDSSGNPVQKALDAHTFSGVGTLRAGRFNWSGPFDNVAFLTQPTSGNQSSSGNVEMLSFDANLAIQNAGPRVALVGGQCVYDMQPGNFDRMQPDPVHQGSTIRNPNLQLAFVAADDCKTSGLNLSIWNVTANPDNGTFVLAPDVSFLPLSTFDPTYPEPFSVTLAATDTQGRSLLLGTPSIVTIEHKNQPSVVIAAPPMHIDYLGGTLNNFTAAPGGFFTSYVTSDSSDSSASTTHTTTWSFAAKESLGVKVTEGECDIGDCTSAGFKASSKQALAGSNAALHGSYSSESVDVSQKTGFYDQVWLTDSTLTIYLYPAIGKTVCPATNPGCADADKVPLIVQFAGPDTITTTSVSGIHVPWYQPPWMPGNMLSYPGSLGQLAAASFADPSDFQSLTDAIRWFTDNGQTTTFANWTVQNTNGSTTSFNQNYSFNTTTSFTAKAGLAGVAVGQVGSSLSVGGSFGFKNLTDSVTTLTKSTGMGFTKQATFANPNLYGYWVTPYIYGEQTPGGVVNNQPLSTDVQTFGILHSGYVVDPVSAGAGARWTQIYTVPDLGLNQPGRWQVTAAAGAPNSPQCLVFDNATSNVDCASLTAAMPSDPWTDEYHWMRGLLITGAETNGTGPQLGSAVVGDKLLLQARVHNFSLASMNPSAEVHVRFYAMPFDTTTSRQAAASIFIGEQKVVPVPPFSVDPLAPSNWVLVPQTFDTSPYQDKDLLFWVVTWAQDSTGKLLPDMPGHGLTRIPDLNTDFACAIGGTCPTSVEEPYSNNVGLYNSPFHIFAAAPTSVSAPAANPEIGVQLTQIGTETETPRRGQRTLVGAKVTTGSQPLTGGLTLTYYDVTPGQGAKIFALQRYPYLAGNTSYEYRAPFHSDVCGLHKIVVVTGQGTRHEQTGIFARPIVVDCRA